VEKSTRLLLNNKDFQTKTTVSQVPVNIQ